MCEQHVPNRKTHLAVYNKGVDYSLYIRFTENWTTGINK